MRPCGFLFLTVAQALATHNFFEKSMFLILFSVESAYKRVRQFVH